MRKTSRQPNEQREQSQTRLNSAESRMRKASRQMPAEWALEVFDKAPYITVSMTLRQGSGQAETDGTPYAVPLSLARTDENTFYFHCAMEGKKLDILRKNPRVCLSAVTKCKPTVGPKDGSFTLEFKSAIAFGVAEEVTDDTEKIEALRAICERFLPKHMHSTSSAQVPAFDASIARSLGRTAVVKITLTEPPVGKRKQYDDQGEEMKSAIK